MPDPVASGASPTSRAGSAGRAASASPLPAGGVVALALVGALLCVPALGGGFVYDDHRFLETNTRLAFPGVLWRAFTDPSVQTGDGTHAGLWRPLRTLLFAVQRAVFGEAPFGWHVVSLLLHGVCCAALALLLRGVVRCRWAVSVGALAFAWHPVQAECVGWVSSQGDLLALALVTTALLLARGGREQAALAAGACGLLAKEQAAVWPLLVLLTASLPSVHRTGWERRRWLRHAAFAGAVTLVFVAVRHAVLDEPFQEGGLTRGAASPAELAAMLAHQAAALVAPVRPVFDWQMPWPLPPAGRFLALALAAVPFILLASRRLRTASAWFLVALVPTLFVQGVLPLNIRVADRFLLFALPALSIGVARIVASVRAARAPAILAVAMLAVLVVPPLLAFRSDESLWSRTAAHVPGHWRANAWSGAAALAGGDVDGALPLLEQAVAAGPLDAKTHYLFATALEQSARSARRPNPDTFRRARDEYRTAAGLWSQPGRQEGRAALWPLARLASIELTLALGEVPAAEAAVRSLLRETAPQLPEAARETWTRRRDSLAAGLTRFARDGELGARLRAWTEEALR